jgi:rhamnosyltransferase
MKISVVIPTYNAEDYIVKLLDKIKHQELQPDEVIVIDSSSSDNTVKLVQDFGFEPIIISQADFDHGGTRNIAAKKSIGDIIIMLTQDALPADNLAFTNIVKPFVDENVSAVCGRQIAYDNTGPMGKHLRYFNYSSISSVRNLNDIHIYGIKTIFLSDSFDAYRRKDLKKIGWFKNNILFGEDSLACANFILSGKSVAYAADAVVYHSHDYTLLQDFYRYFDVGAFHKMEENIFLQFPSAEGEGFRFVKSEILYFFKNKKYLLLLLLPIRIFCKLLGYKLGKNFHRLPARLIPKLSMAPWWWNKQKKGIS